MNLDVAALKRDLIRDEGTGPIVKGRLMPYTDSVGKLSIGIGRNIADRGLSMGEAEFLLQADITDVLSQLTTAFPWALQMSEVRQRVLANMCFNLGLTKLREFMNTIAAMKAGDYAGAAAGMRKSRWAKQTGKRAERLARMMETGIEET